MSNEVKYTPEQQRIIRETDGRMIVSASAGSGKTTVMIERIVGLVKKGVGMDEIVAVTFTEASARDMRAKLERKITELALSDPKYIAELEKLPFAEICTVDSLCKRIVSENFEIAGIDPAFDLVDSSEKEEFSREAFEFACQQMTELEENTGGGMFGIGLVELQKLMGGKDGLRAEIERAASFLSSLPDEKKWLKEVALCVHEREVIDELNDRLLKRVKREAKDLREIADGFSPAVCELTFVATRLDILDEALKGNGWAFLRRERLPSVYKDQIEKAGGDVSVIVPWCDCVKALCDERNYDHGDKQDIEGEVMDLYFVSLLDIYVDALLQIKLSENKLDFYDVEKIALDILRNGEVRQKVLEKYSYVFVDEYQDINELQDELIQRLTGDNLFMVGDVKQSIYMFRHSEPSIFVNATKKNPEELVALKENFRSDSGVIDKVNEVFSHVMEEDSGVDYKAEQMIASRSYERTELQPVYYDVFEKESVAPQRGSVYSVRGDYVEESDHPDEVVAVSNVIEALVKGYSIYDADKKCVRPVTYGDIAVLVRTRKDFYFSLTARLGELGIPVSVDKTRSDALELKVVIDLLRLVDNEVQDIPLASVMLGMFCFCEEELADLAGSARTFYDSIKNSAEPKVAAFWKEIKKLRFLAGYKKVSELIEIACRDTGFLRSLDLASRENVLAFIDTIRGKSFDQSVNRFLLDYETMSDEMVGVPPETGNAVSIMTMHASKGLEFPVTILCDLGSEFISPGGKGDYVLSKEFGVAFKDVYPEKKKKCKNTAFCLVGEEENIRAAHERARLLYVAMTRAKNCLIMTGTVTGSRGKAKHPVKAKSFVQLMEYAFMKGAKRPPSMAQIACPAGEEQVGSAVSSAQSLDLDRIKSALAFKYPYESATRTGVKFAVTGLAVERDEQVGKPLLIEEEIMRAGTLHHKVMEEIDFEIDTREGVKKALDKMVELHTITKRDADLIDVDAILKALGSDVISKARSAREVRREYHFMISEPAREIGVSDSEDDVLVQGVIDLLIIGEDGITVVDYKHTSKSGAPVRERYAKQLELYARAVSEAFKTDVTKKVVLSLKTGEETVI